MWIYECMYVYMYACVCVYIYIYIYIYIYSHSTDRGGFSSRTIARRHDHIPRASPRRALEGTTYYTIMLCYTILHYIIYIYIYIIIIIIIIIIMCIIMMICYAMPWYAILWDTIPLIRPTLQANSSGHEEADYCMSPGRGENAAHLLQILDASKDGEPVFQFGSSVSRSKTTTDAPKINLMSYTISIPGCWEGGMPPYYVCYCSN